MDTVTVMITDMEAMTDGLLAKMREALRRRDLIHACLLDNERLSSLGHGSARLSLTMRVYRNIDLAGTGDLTEAGTAVRRTRLDLEAEAGRQGVTLAAAPPLDEN